jgi:hypothetical protein
MPSSEPLLGRDRIEIPERDWLLCGLLWVAVGTVALGPFGVVARVGRGLFALMLMVHTAESCMRQSARGVSDSEPGRGFCARSCWDRLRF